MNLSTLSTLATGLIVLICIINLCTAEPTNQDVKPAQALHVQEILKHQIKEGEKAMRRRGQRVIKNKTIDVEAHDVKAQIIQDVSRTYGKYHEMIFVRGGVFWMGTNDPRSKTGEYPMKRVQVESFYLDANPVINADYWSFRKMKKFVRTDAEKKGWSWVVDMFLSDETRQYYSMPGAKGWAAVKHAYWGAPEGPDSNLDDRWKHPVVHVSWNDAKLFCEYHGKRLPSEPEWEYAVKIGVTSHAYPWGDDWERKRANVWQGKWPGENKKIDGYSITSPVDAYRPQNLIGLYDMIGNVWEWTSSAYLEKVVHPHLQTNMVVLKGGSFVDSVSGQVNAVIRNGQRMGQKQDYSAANVGFRCAKNVFQDDDLMFQRTEPPPTKAPLQRRRPKFHRRKRDEL